MDGSPADQMDPNQGNYAMINDSNFCGTSSPMTYSQQVIVLSNAVLTPPPPGELISYSQKPDGCHTVFVRGLPVKITEDIIKEGFERYGEILDIRMNRRFCRIKFKNMNSVEQALLLSHYQIKIQNKEGGAYNGKLHVDYAIDQHDFQYRKQRMKREEKHCTFTSSPVHPFSDHEAASVKGKLGSAETKSQRKPIKDLEIEK
ncbi:ecto-NOX disulfide-thiol exchanger 1 [Trichonephila clavipes]|nr:ecto-NOX disulfide-thiol exchanger 1 [Trichonephila clavipes]